MASRFTGSSSMKISSKLWCISSATVIFSSLFSLCQCNDLSFDLPGILPFGISLKILRRNREWLVRNGYYSMKTLWARPAKGGRQMQVSEGSDTFEFRSPHGMKAAHSSLRTFAGIAVRHLQHFNHPGRAWHDLSGPHYTLTVVLAEIGGRCEARTNLHRPAALERQRPNHISFVPAEMRVWGYTDDMESVRELRLSFDRKSLGDWFGTDLDPGKAGNPELMFHDQEHLDLSVSVFQLARLVDLSSSQFARMFKASTGVSPHRHQLNTRICISQDLLLMKVDSLSIVALTAGFADQSHFTRTFKRVTGATPHEWHRNRTP